MIEYVFEPSGIDVLLERHRRDNKVFKTERLSFSGVDGFDVYNISHEFFFGGEYYIAGRVEKRDSEISDVVLFKRVEGGVYSATDVRIKNLQDPCFTVINGKPVLGGTKIYFDNDGRINDWNTAFYTGDDLNSLKKFLDAPKKMKDVRLFETDEIEVFTRPQGGAAGAGKIGYASAPSLSEITIQTIENAPLLTTQFAQGTWGGVNQVHLLKNGKLGVLGHIAVMSEGDVRHYYGMVFCFDTKTGRSTQVKIICERSDFESGAYKREDLIDVVFAGGLVRNGDGTAYLYVGLSDAESHRALIADPFAEYEEEGEA